MSTVHRHVLLDVSAEGLTDAVEEFLAARVAHGAVGEVGVHTRAVPVALDRFWMVFDVVAVAFGQTVKKVASYPKFVACLLGALGENLEFPLATGHFLVDAFKVDTSLKAKIGVFLNEGTSVSVLSTN